MNYDLQISIRDIVAKEKSDFIREWHKALCARFHEFTISVEQDRAWRIQCGWLHDAASKISETHGNVVCFFEFSVPLQRERCDLLFVTDKEFLVVEVKTGEKHSVSAAQQQCFDYASELVHFLLTDRERRIIPVVLHEISQGTDLVNLTEMLPGAQFDAEDVAVVSADAFAKLLASLTPPEVHGNQVETSKWMRCPRPTVSGQASEQWGKGLSRAATSALAPSVDTDRLITELDAAIASTREQRKHLVVAVTGAPGSGKTMVGLRIAHQPSIGIDENHPDWGRSKPLYLSGNKPLVDVVVADIADAWLRTQESLGVGIKKKKGEARRTAGTHIMWVHNALEKSERGRIFTNVIVFDEAQRAWTATHRRSRDGAQLEDSDDVEVDIDETGEPVSEPSEILEIWTEREWAVVVLLVGTGQHIHNGEEGMATWYEAIRKQNQRLTTEGRSGKSWSLLAATKETEDIPTTISPSLNLRVDERAKGTAVNDWVNLLLDGRINEAAACRSQFKDFPLTVTRDLEKAKNWLRVNTHRGVRETGGLVASSKNSVLHHYGIRTKESKTSRFNVVDFYLERPPHMGSCLSFEWAATEFDCQGLELDRVAVCWSWDLQWSDAGWTARKLNEKNREWSSLDRSVPTQRERFEFRINAYRVLLSRSRQGMVIWVPPGITGDDARMTSEVDEIYDVLIKAGCSELV